MPKQRNATCIACVSGKGGVGKSSLALNFGAGYLAYKLHKKVLMIDLDYQGNLTASLKSYAINIKYNEIMKKRPNSDRKDINNKIHKDVTDHITKSSIYRAFKHQADNPRDNYPKDFRPASISKNVDLFASDPKLDDVDNLMRNNMETSSYVLLMLFVAFDIGHKYDYIIIDNHNSFKMLTRNALVVSNKLLAPISPSSYSLDSISMMNNKIKEIQNHLIDPTNQKSFVNVTTYYVGSMIEANTHQSRAFESAISQIPSFVASIPKRQIFNRASFSNVYSLVQAEQKAHKHNNDLKALTTQIDPEFKKIFNAIK